MSNTLIETLKKICVKYELDDFTKDMETGLNRILLSGLRVAFLGPVKAGKSTLINALLEQELLPVQETPTTGCITELRRGDELKYFVHLNSELGVIEEINRDKATLYITGKKPAKKVVIEMPAAGMLQEGVFVVDTPGIKSTIPTHDLITQEYLPSIDAAFFVMSGQYGAPQAEILDFIRDDVKEADLDKLYFIISKSDLFPHNEQDLIMDEFRKHLSAAIESPRVFFVSGMKALENAWMADEEKAGNLGAITGLIQEEILPRKKRVLTSKSSRFLSDKANQLIAILERIREDSELDTEELKENSSKVKEEIAELEALESRLSSSFRKIRNEGYTAADSVAYELTDTMVAHYKRTGELPDEELDEVLNRFQERLRRIVSNGLQGVDGIDVILSMPGIQEVLGDVSTWNNIIGGIDKIATFAATAWIAPGLNEGLKGVDLAIEGLPAALTSLSELFGKKSGSNEDSDLNNSSKKKESEKDKEKSSGQKFLQHLKGLAQVVNKLNLIHHASEGFLKPLIFKEVSKKKFRRKMRTYTEEYFGFVSNALRIHLDIEIIEPLRQKNASYRSLVNMRQKEGDVFRQRISEITDDIRIINLIQNGSA